MRTGEENNSLWSSFVGKTDYSSSLRNPLTESIGVGGLDESGRLEHTGLLSTNYSQNHHHVRPAFWIKIK